MNWFAFFLGAFTLGCYFMPNPATPSMFGVSWAVINGILLFEAMGLFLMAFFGVMQP